MDAPHIHLMLNHVPVLGTVFGLLVLGYGLARRSQEVVRTALWTLVIVGVASGVVYLTGEPAEELVEGLPGFSHPILEEHEAAALWATVGAALVGVVSVVGLVRYRAKEISRRYSIVLLLLTLASAGLMGWTANLGGQVMHGEIRAEAAASTDAGVDHEADDAEGRDGH